MAFAVFPVSGSCGVSRHSRTRGRDCKHGSATRGFRFASTTFRRGRGSPVLWRAAKEVTEGADSTPDDPPTPAPAPDETTPSLAEATSKFKHDFWNEIGENVGGVPFLKNRKRGGGRAVDGGDLGVGGEGDDLNTDGGAKKKRISEADSSNAPNKQKQTFWSQCTVLGLVLGAWFLVWGLTSMHWPTVVWTVKHPNALRWSPDLGWSVVLEIGKRLGPAALRLITSVCAVRSKWTRGFLAAFVSFVLPSVEGV